MTEFEVQIDNIVAAAEALPIAHDVYSDHPDPCHFASYADFQAAPPAPYIGAARLCESLSRVSQEIRSICWNGSVNYRAVANRADRECARIAEKFGLAVRSPLPIKGSVGMDATGCSFGGSY